MSQPDPFNYLDLLAYLDEQQGGARPKRLWRPRFVTALLLLIYPLFCLRFLSFISPELFMSSHKNFLAVCQAIFWKRAE